MSTNVSAERRRAVWFVVGSWRCGCGERKRPMRAFCDKCWAKVPSDKKKQLVKMLKGGFVMAFEETRALLGHGPMPEMRPRTNLQATVPEVLQEIATACGGKITEVGGPLSDGSGFAIMSMPLPKDHWIYDKGPTDFNVPPMPLRVGAEEGVVIKISQHNNVSRFRTMTRWELGQAIRDAGKYAVRTATMNGKEMDFDPDALVQNLVVGFLGYCTRDGLDHQDDWANPTKEWSPTPAVTRAGDSLSPTEGAPNLYPPSSGEGKV